MDDSEIQIYPDNEKFDSYTLEIVGVTGISLTRSERDMFVLLHEEAMDQELNVFSFNQDAPKHTLKLSGEDDLDADVELE